MLRTYSFQLIRQPEARGLNRINGTVEAHDVKGAMQQVNAIVEENARVGLMKGRFVLMLRTESLILKNRTIDVASRYADEGVPMIDGPDGRTLVEILSTGS
jgi:hypothetical protein